MRKKTLVFLAAVLVVVAMFANTITPVRSSPTAKVKIDPHYVMASVGSQFNISIVIEDVTGLFAFDIKLRWDPTVLSCLNIQSLVGVESHPDGILYEGESGILALQNNVFNESDQVPSAMAQFIPFYWVVYSSMAPAPPFNGTGKVATLTFNVTAAGSSRFDLLEIDLSDSLAGVIPYEPVDGAFGRLSIRLSSSTVASGSEVTINCTSEPAQANWNVTILYRGQGETAWKSVGTSRTDSEGKFSMAWTPTSAGTLEVVASMIDPEDPSATLESNSLTLIVTGGELPTWVYVVIVIVVLVVVVGAVVVLRRRKKPEVKEEFEE